MTMKSRIFKAIGGLIIALILAISFTSAAYAVAVTISCSGTNVPPNQIYNSSGVGGTLLASGAFVQIIQSTDSTPGDPDPTTGAPAGDTIITPTGTLSAPGNFSASRNITASNYVYIRAWETWNGVGTPTGRWGTSIPASVGTGFAFTYRPASFATNQTPPVPAPTIGLSASTFTFAAQVGTNPANQTLNISNTGSAGTTLNWTVTDDAAWLSCAPASGSVAQGAAPSAVTLSVNTAGLVVGTYTGHITVTGQAGTTNTPQTVTVTLNITAVPPTNPTIGLSPATLTFAAQVGGSNPANQNISISNTGAAGSTLNWSATDDAAWLTVGPPASGAQAQGAAAASVPVSVNISGLAVGAYTGTITVVGQAGTTNTPQTVAVTLNITTTPPPPTSVVIDDYEGICVNPATGYYNAGFAGAGTPVPTMTRVTGAANLHEGTYGMNTVYAAGAASPNDWRGWGGVLTSAKNISATNTISFWMKGDGSANKVKIQFKDADGSNYGVADTDAVPLTDTTWREYKIPISRLTNQIAAGTAAGLDPANITEYQFVFSGTAASTGVLIDYVMAITEGVSTDPQIISISPTSGPSGTVVTITGSNLDVAGTVQFATEGGVVTAVNSSATNTPITAWSAASITMRIPSMTNGSKNVKVVRASDLRESNTVTFEVTGAAATDSLTNTYPNPFNPLGGEVTRIVFSPGSATRADILIFDMTAKLVSKLNWPTTGTIRPDGRVEVTWDGKNSYGEIVGDGVYLYRVVDGGVRKGKILVVNKK